MDSQTLQTLVVALAVAAAALFVLARFYRTLAAARRAKDGECGGGCCTPKH